jgi:hypothetical protein
MWFHLDQMFTGTSVLGAAAPNPTTVCQYHVAGTFERHGSPSMTSASSSPFSGADELQVLHQGVLLLLG